MRPALEVADIFRRHGEAFRRDHAARLGRVERRVMAAIEACRTAALGGTWSDAGIVAGSPRLQLLPQPALPKVPGPGACRAAQGPRYAALCSRPKPEPLLPETYRERHRRLSGHHLDVCPDCGGQIREGAPLQRRPPPPRAPFWCDRS